MTQRLLKLGLPSLIVLLLTAHPRMVAADQARDGQPATGAGGDEPAPTAGTRRPSVLALYSDSSDTPLMVELAQELHAALKERSGNTVDHYTEFFDSARFSSEEQARIMRDYLRRKYADRPIDVLFAWGPFTLPFVLEYRGELFPNTPIVYYAGSLESVKGYAQPPMTGVLQTDTYVGTLEVALSLHPGTREVFVISGTPARDKVTEREVSRQLEGFRNRVRFTYLTDLPLDELMAAVKRIPQRSIIIYSRHEPYHDREKGLQLGDYVDLVSRSALVPVYGPFRSSIGYGIVGGIVDDRAAGAAQAADIVWRVAHGTPPEEIPPGRIPRIPMFDARQLTRWGVSEDRLPPGSVVLYREPTVWSQYRSYIIGTGALLVVQTLLIGGLLVQRARRRRTENALRESEERFRLMADTAPVKVWRTDADNVCDFFNLRWLEFRGRSLEEETGTGWTEGVHPADLERCLALRSTSFDERRPFRLEYRLQRGDGEYRWVLDTGVPRFAPDGTFAGYIGSSLDITERRQAEEALQESETRYALATAAASVGVWDWNLETDEVYVDPALTHALGFPDRNIGSLDSWMEHVHPDDAERFRQDARAHLAAGTPFFEQERRMRHRDGSIRWFLTRGSAVREADGRIQRIIGTDTDITDRKSVEARLEETHREFTRL